MRKTWKLLAATVGLLAVTMMAQGAVIYSTDCVETPSGATSTYNKGQWNTQAVSWATGYTYSFQTTGSAGTMTYTFSPAISTTSGDTLKVYWGSTSNRPLKVGINGGSDTQIDAVSSSTDRSQVRVATTVLSVTSVSSLKFISSGGGNVYLFKIEIVGAGGSTPPTPPTPSTDATLSDLKVDGVTIAGFASTTLNYSYTVPSSQTALPVVTATATNAQATPQVTQTTSMTGQASVLVTAADGTTKLTYTVQFSQSGSVDPPTPPTPPTPTTLTIHETEIYEAPAIMGGYGGTLSSFGGREYEVYYINRDASGSNMSISISNVDKSGSITTGTTNAQCAANDGWLTAKVNGNSSASDALGDEFSNAVRRSNMQAADSIVMHVKGYSQFALAGVDNSTNTGNNEKHLQVWVDGVARSHTLSTSLSIRRYALTTGEHVIKIGAVGGSSSRVYAFSLQVAYVPKLKHLKGNDSTQVVWQTAAIKPVTYYLKNRISDAELTWEGATATGITLQQNAAGDTLTLGGTAECPVGAYRYTIIARDSAGAVASSISGTFSVDTKMECTTNNLNMSVFANSAIKPVVFRCYTLDMNNVTGTWTGQTPAGLSFAKDATNHTLTLSGTPTVAGTYGYTVSLNGGNTMSGTITVKSDQPTVLPGKPTLLYLIKNTENDGLYNYITSSGKYGYFARPAADAMGADRVYANYDAIVISEDVDANNAEVLGIIRSLRKPVLNMKIFTYTKSRLGWGDPDNGSISNKKITVLQPDHAIFSGLTGTDITVLSAVSDNKGLMPAEVNYAGTVCLATAPKRGDNYDDEGEPQTFIHEVPAAKRGGKYLSLPIGISSTSNLTNDGKRLFDNMIAYLTSEASASVVVPTVQITGFSINGTAGIIDQQAKTITINLPKGTNITALAPEITLADSRLTYVTPGSGETVDFSDLHYGVVYTVSDFITKVQYTAKVRVGTDLDDAEADGLSICGDMLHNPQGVWVNIYSASGQLITTTNSDFGFAGMPRGMYLVKSANSVLKVVH